MSRHALANGRGAGLRSHKLQDHEAEPHQSHAVGSRLPVQAKRFVAPHFPFQPLPAPNGEAPYRFDLAKLLHEDALAQIKEAGKIVFHTVGDTGDERGRQMDFVAQMMTEDYDKSDMHETPAFFYHLGDVVYFAGDVDAYGENFYETYAEYPGLIVSIPGNHDCQPDDPQDGPVDPNKKPLDGWVQNFMSKDPTQLGSLKTNSSRTQMDLPNVYWTFTTPFATIIGLFSNVGEVEAEIHQDQIDWFRGELRAADKDLALIVAIHHPPFSGDLEHSGSNVAEKVLFESFAATGTYPHLILSGHVHLYQRFTVKQTHVGENFDIACIVAADGGYTKLGRLHKIDGAYPVVPFQLSATLSLEKYNQTDFGFSRIEITKNDIIGCHISAPYQVSGAPAAEIIDSFKIDLRTRKITTT